MNIYAFIGSLALIFFLIKREKDRHDKGGKTSWSKFFSNNWDDFALAVISGQMLAYIQEPVYFGVVRFMDWDYQKHIDIYFDAEEAVSFVVGFSATFVIGYLYRYVVKKTSEPKDKS